MVEDLFEAPVTGLLHWVDVYICADVALYYLDPVVSLTIENMVPSYLVIGADCIYRLESLFHSCM